MYIPIELSSGIVSGLVGATAAHRPGVQHGSSDVPSSTGGGQLLPADDGEAGQAGV